MVRFTSLKSSAIIRFTSLKPGVLTAAKCELIIPAAHVLDLRLERERDDTQFKSLALALAALVGGASAISQEVAEYALRAEFKAFEAKFGKAYSSAELRESKFWTFVQNLEDVVSKNAALKFKSLALALAALVGGASAISQEVAEYALRAEFKAFEAKFGKAYSSAELRESKFWTFVQNLEDVVSKNAALKAEGKDEVHGITKFADVTKDEFAAKMLTFRPAEANLTGVPVMKPTKEASDSTFDWRDSGVVTPVKNQAYCGSCWAFSATETVESQYAIAGNTLTELSVQQTVSCDTTDGGCGGGWYYTAWMDYMAPNGGLTTESNYPYDSQTAAGTASLAEPRIRRRGAHARPRCGSAAHGAAALRRGGGSAARQNFKQQKPPASPTKQLASLRTIKPQTRKPSAANQRPQQKRPTFSFKFCYGCCVRAACCILPLPPPPCSVRTDTTVGGGRHKNRRGNVPRMFRQFRNVLSVLECSGGFRMFRRV